VRTNLEGLIKVTRACSPHLTDAVVNIASVMGLSGMGGAPVYTATKWGVRGFSKALAAERSDLRVFPVNPGATKTQMTGFAGVPPEQVADIVVRLVKGELDVASGDDVTISDYL
jgi:3alpha(or 20beta)-hydroxysteroid dehydrogenase